MPCLPCRSSMMGLIQMAARSGKGPSSDVPFDVGSTYRLGPTPVPEGFLSPRLCMLCGSVYCPPIADLPTVYEDGVTVAVGGDGRGGAGTGPEERLSIAVTSLDPPATVSHGVFPPAKPIRIRPEWWPNTAMAVLRLLESISRDEPLEEARRVLAAAVRSWKEMHGEG